MWRMTIFICHICGEQKNTLGHRCFRWRQTYVKYISKDKYIAKGEIVDKNIVNAEYVAKD